MGNGSLRLCAYACLVLLTVVVAGCGSATTKTTATGTATTQAAATQANGGGQQLAARFLTIERICGGELTDCAAVGHGCNETQNPCMAVVDFNEFCEEVVDASAPTINASGAREKVANITHETPAEFAKTEYLEHDASSAGEGEGTGLLLSPTHNASIGCHTKHFRFFLEPTGPKQTVSPNYVHPAYGHCALSKGTEITLNDEAGMALACETPNGWSYEVSESFTPNISEAVLKEQYERLARALSTPPAT